MATHALIRWDGLVSIVATVSFIAMGVLMVSAPMLAGAWVELLAFALMPYAILALYAAQAEVSGALGLLGFVLGTLGIIPILAFVYLHIARLSGIDEARAVIRYYNTVIPLFQFGPLLFFVGLFLLGLGTMPANVLPRWAGILLGVGAVLAVFGNILPTLIVAVIASVVIGIALAWLGYMVWSGKRTMAMLPQPAR